MPMPLMRMRIFTTRKPKKHTHCPRGHAAHAGNRMPSTVLMALPPIQNWMPHQPAATTPRRMAATLAPLKPKALRQ